MACQIRHKFGGNYAHCRAAPRVGWNSLALEDTKARNQSSPSKLIACLIRNEVGGKYADCRSVSRVSKNSLASKMEKLDEEDEGKARDFWYIHSIPLQTGKEKTFNVTHADTALSLITLLMRRGIHLLVLALHLQLGMKSL